MRAGSSPRAVAKFAAVTWVRSSVRGTGNFSVSGLWRRIPGPLWLTSINAELAGGEIAPELAEPLALGSDEEVPDADEFLRMPDSRCAMTAAPVTRTTATTSSHAFFIWQPHRTKVRNARTIIFGFPRTQGPC